MNRQRAIINKFYQSFKKTFYNDTPAKHINPLQDFQKTEFGENTYQQDINFNNWMYNNNPSNDRYYCLQDNQVVGQQSAIGTELFLNGELINAAYAIDLRIRPEWKMKGLGVAMIGALMEKYDVLIGVGVSDEAYKMFIRQGWLDLGRTETFIKPLDMSCLKKRTVKANFSTSLKYIIALLISNLSNIYRKCLSRKYTFKKLSHFTKDHEKIVDSTLNENVISSRKTKEYLNWRFIDFPGNNNYESYELIDNNIPQAFFSIKRALINGTDIIIISEVHANKTDLPAIIDYIIELSIQKKACTIIYNGLDEDIQYILKSRYFFHHPEGDRFVVFSNKPEFETALMKKENWKINYADSDADFFLLNDERQT